LKAAWESSRSPGGREYPMEMGDGCPGGRVETGNILLGLLRKISLSALRKRFFGWKMVSLTDQHACGKGKTVAPSPRFLLLTLGVALSLSPWLASELQAFSITEKKIFTQGPYLFQIEVQMSGRGSTKKNPMKMTALKVKIKNDRASSQTLMVKSIRAYLDPRIHQDIETAGYPVTPGQWVTKYYRLPKEKQPLLGEQGLIEIAFDTFLIRFKPRERKFQGPVQ
jgi:hypothetical protein